MTVKKRILEFIDYKKISQARFEKETGLSNGYVNNIRKSISENTLKKITNAFPELNRIWLMLGEGEMLNNQPVIQEPPTGHYALAEKDKIIEWLNRELKDKREIICHLIEESKQKNGEINKLKSELDMLREELKKKEPSLEK